MSKINKRQFETSNAVKSAAYAAKVELVDLKEEDVTEEALLKAILEAKRELEANREELKAILEAKGELEAKREKSPNVVVITPDGKFVLDGFSSSGDGIVILKPITWWEYQKLAITVGQFIYVKSVKDVCKLPATNIDIFSLVSGRKEEAVVAYHVEGRGIPIGGFSFEIVAVKQNGEQRLGLEWQVPLDMKVVLVQHNGEQRLGLQLTVPQIDNFARITFPREPSRRKVLLENVSSLKNLDLPASTIVIYLNWIIFCNSTFLLDFCDIGGKYWNTHNLIPSTVKSTVICFLGGFVFSVLFGLMNFETPQKKSIRFAIAEGFLFLLCFILSGLSNAEARQKVVETFAISSQKTPSQLYRLLTASWLHSNLLHIRGNMTLLKCFHSYAVEIGYGFYNYLIVYLLAGVASELAAYYELLWNPKAKDKELFSIGASGSVYGLLVFGYLYIGNLIGGSHGAKWTAMAAFFIVAESSMFMVRASDDSRLFAFISLLLGGALLGDKKQTVWNRLKMHKHLIVMMAGSILSSDNVSHAGHAAGGIAGMLLFFIIPARIRGPFIPTTKALLRLYMDDTVDGNGATPLANSKPNPPDIDPIHPKTTENQEEDDDQSSPRLKAFAVAQLLRQKSILADTADVDTPSLKSSQEKDSDDTAVMDSASVYVMISAAVVWVVMLCFIEYVDLLPDVDFIMPMLYRHIPFNTSNIKDSVALFHIFRWVYGA